MASEKNMTRLRRTGCVTDREGFAQDAVCGQLNTSDNNSHAARQLLYDPNDHTCTRKQL